MENNTSNVEKRTFDLNRINLIGIPVSIGLILIVIIPYTLLHGWEPLSTGIDTLFEPFWRIILIFIGSIIVHEGLHGLGWMLFGGIPPNRMKFGVKMMTPYAHSKEPMHAAGYRIGAALPGIILGVVPGIAALVTGVGWLAVYGAFMLSAAAGDALILWLIRDVPGSVQVQDHPSEAGCEILWSA